MGFTSFTCAKTNLPILASESWGATLSEVVMLTDTKQIRGSYDGYGRLHTQQGKEVQLDFDSVYAGTTKFVLAEFYKGEKAKELHGQSHHEPGQGHFHQKEQIDQWHAQGGFPSHEAYLHEFETAYGWRP